MHGGHWDIGTLGIQLSGAAWLLAAIAFSMAGVALLASWPWWHTGAIAVALASLALCGLSWPEAQFCAYIDLVILAVLIAAPPMWLAF